MENEVIFITGAGGFLGKRLLSRLLPLSCRIFLLVQDKFIPEIQKFLEAWKAGGSLKASVTLVAGDISRPRLGLEEGIYNRLQSETTVVWHLAAAYSLTLDKPTAERVNIEGTRHVIAFAGGLRGLKSLGYLSTTAISGTHTGRYGEDDFDVGQNFKNHYEWSKFEAEKIVRRRLGDLPLTIFRPTIIVGDSQTGKMEKIDGPYYGFVMISRKLHFILQKSQAKCHVEPVDFVVDAIESLLANPQASGQVIHIADPQPVTYDEFFEMALARWPTFKPVVRIPARWMLPFFSLPGFSRLTGVPRQSFLYTLTPVDYGTERMCALLKGTGIACPPVYAYLDNMIRYFKEHRKKGLKSLPRW